MKYKNIICSWFLIIFVFPCMWLLSACENKESKCTHVCEWIVSKEPTCTNSGIKSYTCKTCEEVLYTEELEILGHDLAYKYNKTATCTENGEKETYCKRCNFLEKEAINAHGHSNWINVKGEGTKLTFDFICYYECGRKIFIQEYDCKIQIKSFNSQSPEIDFMQYQGNILGDDYCALPNFKVIFKYVDNYYHILVLKSNNDIRTFVDTNLQQWSWENKVNYYKNQSDISVELEIKCNMINNQVVFY